MKLAKLILSSCLVAGAVNAAVTVNILSNSSFGFYQDSGAAALGDGSLLRYGTFDEAGYDLLSTAQRADYATVDALFTELGTVSASGGDFFSTGNSYTFPVSGISTGDKLYTWVFNTSDASVATEWGIFSSSNSLWNVATDPGTTTLSNNNIDNFVVGSAGAGTNVLLSAVPEPSTYAAIAGFLALGVAMVRRRRA